MFPKLAFVPEWADDALCQDYDPDTFFPQAQAGRSKSRAGSAQVREAQAICNLCPVRLKCLNYALDNDERYGIWGGVDIESAHINKYKNRGI